MKWQKEEGERDSECRYQNMWGKGDTYHWGGGGGGGSRVVPDPRRRHKDKGEYNNHIIVYLLLQIKIKL